MILSRAHLPPAPPPFWQPEPIVSDRSAEWSWLTRIPILSLGAFVLAIAFGFAVWQFRRKTKREDRLRNREIRIRHVLTRFIGTEANWLSADGVAKRLIDSGYSRDEAAESALRGLRAIETRRFGPDGMGQSSPRE